jgi:hypothetical protein
MFFTRKEALDNGEITYNGRSCKYCGGVERYSSTTTCVPCTKLLAKENNKIYSRKNSDKVNAYNRKVYSNLTEEKKLLRNRKQQLKIYGLTLEDYNVMLEKQNGVCAICNKEEKTKNKNLFVDHDHQTGKVRSLLCNNCNSGLGQFNDNLNLLESAVLYLKKYS